MSKSDVFEADLLDLIFKGTAIANIADNAATSPLTVLYVSLHTADPGEAGTQTTSEISYTGYARQAVTRGAGWTRTGSSISPTTDVTFPASTGGTGGTITHFAVGTALTGTGKILYKGTYTPNQTVANGVQPRLLATTTITED